MRNIKTRGRSSGTSKSGYSSRGGSQPASNSKLKKKNALSEINEFSEIIMTFVFLSEDGVNPQEIIDIIARDSSPGIFKKVF